jgi:hypothetical protein
MFIENAQIFSDVVCSCDIVEGLSLETLLTLKLEKYLICLVGTRRPTRPIIEQGSILFLKK